ncbi:hypothetical protein QOZ80_8BG0648060 [Eleusine coracana subsp. coracana]|nr:hypothetical protein QOZ80_8BG0648060 [Eleusine coracana subsp. coracana]
MVQTKGGPMAQTKGGLAAQTKGAQRHQPQAVALSAYEKERLSNCMQNNTRLQQLGLPTLTLMFAQAATSHRDKNKSAQRNAEESNSEYDPSWDGDGIGEQDLIDGNAKLGSREETSYMPPGGDVVKFKNRKRVFPAEPCTRAAIEDDGLALPDDNAHMTDNTERHNHMDNEDDSAQHGDENENATMAAGDRDLTHPANQITAAGGQQGIRRATMGHGLERVNRVRRGKLQVVINEGSIRPVHWKDYKDKPTLLEMFMGCLRAKFHIDTSDETIKKACREMMKKAVHQQRHNLKKKIFYPFPLHRVTKTSPVKCMSNEQWIDLVESWKSPKKMEICQMNKFSRGNVKSHKKTGSRSYEVFVENDLGDKYKDEEPNAIDLFKECHYSNKTKGFTPEVQSIITQMETVLATTTEV